MQRKSIMDITSVRIFLNKGSADSKVKGVAHVVINNAIVLRRIHLIENENDAENPRVVYPVYHLQTQGHRRCFYASNDESMARLNETILAAYKTVLADPANDTVVLMSQDDPETPFEITSASIYPHNDPESSTLAKVNIELDGELWLRGMYLMKKEDGTVYLRMPRRTHADGKRVDLFHPRTQVARDMLTDAVMPLYEVAVKAMDEAAADDAAPDAAADAATTTDPA